MTKKWAAKENPPYEHTPTPWSIEDGLQVQETAIYADGILVAQCEADESGERSEGFMPEAEGKANAAFIVRAVNAHDDLVTALQSALDVIAGHIHGEEISRTFWKGRHEEITNALKKAGAAQ